MSAKVAKITKITKITKIASRFMGVVPKITKVASRFMGVVLWNAWNMPPDIGHTWLEGHGR
jgi:hypothetical protein